MSTPLCADRLATRASRPADLATLAERARPVSLAGERQLPVPAALAPLLPGGGLRRGGTVAVGGSTSLALALVSSATAGGAWLGVVGLPDIGLAAAAELGVRLDRLLLVPVPGRAWGAVVATLADALDVVLAAPPPRLAAPQARQLSIRARERGTVLMVHEPVLAGPSRREAGGWPERVDLRLGIAASSWLGLGVGHGRLTARRAQVVSTGRGAAALERRAWMWLPDRDGAVRPAEAPGGSWVEPDAAAGAGAAGRGAADTADARTAPLRAVG